MRDLLGQGFDFWGCAGWCGVEWREEGVRGREREENKKGDERW